LCVGPLGINRNAGTLWFFFFFPSGWRLIDWTLVSLSFSIFLIFEYLTFTHVVSQQAIHVTVCLCENRRFLLYNMPMYVSDFWCFGSLCSIRCSGRSRIVSALIYRLLINTIKRAGRNLRHFFAPQVFRIYPKFICLNWRR